MDISVVIPFYNRVDWLYQAVNSIKEKKDISYEIIIINDGSKEEIDISKFTRNKDKVKIFKQTNQGPGKARNFGISKASGEYISFLDSDDLFVNYKLGTQLKFMREFDYSWSHTSYFKFYEDDKKEIINNAKYHGTVFPYCFAYNPIATPTVMIKSKALENPKKRFSEEMRFGEDGFMWSQLASYYSLGIIEEPLSQVRMRGTNATLRAENHLYVKSKMYGYMKQNDKYYNHKKIPLILKIIFIITSLNYKVLNFIFSEKSSKLCIEKFSRLLYTFPYFSLKIYKRKFRK